MEEPVIVFLSMETHGTHIAMELKESLMRIIVV